MFFPLPSPSWCHQIPTHVTAELLSPALENKGANKNFEQTNTRQETQTHTHNKQM